MGKSIINPKSERCFLCGWKTPLEAHHIFHGTARRRLADEDGMIVYICRECHREVHEAEDREHDESLKAMGEMVWCRYYGKTIDDFIKRYGKNYIFDEEEES